MRNTGKKQVFILNYHRIDDGANDIPDIEKVFTVTRESFEAQIKILADNKIPVISLDDLIQNNAENDFSVVITCDDGNKSDYRIVYPVLKKYGMTCTFFWQANKLDFINKTQVREMIDNGFSVGSHGISHKDLTKMNAVDVQKELEDSRQILEELTGSPVHYFALPYGTYNKRTIKQLILSGYKAILTTDPELIDPEARSLVLGRWSVKRTITPGLFEKIIRDKNSLNRLIIKHKMKKFVRKAVGRTMADKINVLLLPGDKRDHS